MKRKHETFSESFEQSRKKLLVFEMGGYWIFAIWSSGPIYDYMGSAKFRRR